MIPDFEVTVLGNTSSTPVHGRHPTSQVVRFGQELFLIDCGEGTQMQLRKFKIKTSKISHIFISHLHGDHYLGLVGLLSSYNLNSRTKPLTIHGPKGLDEIITTQFRWSKTSLSYLLTFVQTKPDGLNTLLESEYISISSFPMKHRLPTTGFLIKEKKRLRNLIKEKLEQVKLPLEGIKKLRNGENFIDLQGNKYFVNDFAYPQEPLRSYAFCSDTCYDPSLKVYINEVGLLYHESTFMEEEKGRAEITQHSTAKQAGEIASICGVKKLLLGHYSSRYHALEGLLDEAKTVFPSAMLSVEGETYEIL